VKNEPHAKATIPDLVVLSFLADRPMHGYELNQELIRCEVEDWAGISRPQVYYSLKKLRDLGWIRAVESEEPAAGPERQPFAITATGRRVLGEALTPEDWATQRPPPPFLTWLALSAHASAPARRRVIRRRRSFLREQADKERRTLAEMRAEAGVPGVALLMVELGIRQFELELAWLDEVEAALEIR
jgi:DNA-binding PadR family transcriptional regulator